MYISLEELSGAIRLPHFIDEKKMEPQTGDMAYTVGVAELAQDIADPVRFLLLSRQQLHSPSVFSVLTNA